MSCPLPKFAADRMLGKLAKWLRVCGLDVLYSNNIAWKEILEVSQDQGRAIVTRDTRVFGLQAYREIIFIKHDLVEEQLKQFFLERVDIDPYSLMFTRCIECNVNLMSIEKGKVKDRVWPYVFETQNSFNICPTCSRIFWGGTHKKNMEKRLSLILEGVPVLSSSRAPDIENC